MSSSDRNEDNLGPTGSSMISDHGDEAKDEAIGAPEEISEAELNRLGLAVWNAAKDGNLDRLRAAERQGGSLGWENVDGSTPLKIASLYNRIGVVNYLLTRDVDLNTVSTRGMSALHYAALFGNTEIAVALLEAGIDYTIVYRDDIDQYPWRRFGKTAQQFAESHDNVDTTAAIIGFIADHVAGAVEDV